MSKTYMLDENAVPAGYKLLPELAENELMEESTDARQRRELFDALAAIATPDEEKMYMNEGTANASVVC
jgi:hypothetical protein